MTILASKAPKIGALFNKYQYIDVAPGFESNIDRFPGDFMFDLTKEEQDSLGSQIMTLKRGQHSKYPPFAFTEQGEVMHPFKTTNN